MKDWTDCTLEEFPASEITAPGIRDLEPKEAKPTVRIHLNVEYGERDGRRLRLQIATPYWGEGESRYPVVAYIQGSAWIEQDLGLSLAPLAEFARRGFVVAVVEYRPTSMAPFPAQLLDTKAALRYLKDHAGEYGGDPDKLAVWGDSSGGHTALLAGITQDVEELRGGDPKPLGIRGIVDYYGPTHVGRMYQEPSITDHLSAGSPEGLLIGGLPVREHPEEVAPTVAMNYLDRGNTIPPILAFHGDKDRIVPFGQSVMLYEACKERGLDMELYRIRGADHGGPAFWCGETLDLVEAFLRRHTGP